MKNTFEWTGTTGTEFKIEISYAEKLVDEVLHFDGYEVNTGKKEVEIDAELAFFVNGKKVDSCCNTSYWGMIDVIDEKLNAMGVTKKIWGLKALLTAERAEEIEQFIADYIAANKLEKPETEPTETKTEETEPTETKTEETETIETKTEETETIETKTEETETIETKTESVRTKTKGTKSERCHKCGTYCYGDCSY